VPLAAFLISPTLADEYVLSVGGEQIAFDPGDGYCPLDPDKNQINKVLFDWQRKAQRPHNELLAYFAPCDALDRLGKGAIEQLPSWSLLLAALRDGRPARFRGVSRPQFLGEMAKAMAGDLDVDDFDVSKRLNETLPDDLAGEIGKVGVSGMKQLGVLHRDEAAIYSGLLADVSVGEEKSTVAAVISTTLMNGYAVTYNNYREFKDQSTFESLIDEAKESMRKFIELNEPRGSLVANVPASTREQAPSWMDWVAENAVSGILIGVLIGAGFGLFAWFKRRPS